ncbi:unnamed protein product [Effrenium voratum]|uniref:MI domain-containing protein n=1 Tax=Effrenium voratum TaxID=2562239 RepID=A0AA36IH76_9DINO|nr:unnamed protein product [Effrenium voratum]
MLIDCCAMEKMFNRFFVLQAQRLCRLNPIYQDNFTEAFGVQFNTVHRLETNKLRNIGKFFAHLLYTDAIPWSIWAQVKISEETTTSSSRIFIKVIFQELSELWGIKKLVDRLREEELKPFFVGLFPKDHPKNVRFAINYFTAIGLGVLTEDLRSFLEQAAEERAMEARLWLTGADCQNEKCLLETEPWLARMQKEIEDKTSAEYQRQTWEVGNIKNIVEDWVAELFQENLVRGALIRAQMASPGFTHVFAALLAVINSKLLGPEVGDLLIRRVILQFRRAYKRNDKIVTTAAIKFMAHLVNQKICSELLALHVATLLLERVTEDSIEVCVSFLQEVGQALEDLSKSGCQAIFERFRTILHEGEIDKRGPKCQIHVWRVQYVIEGLFETRRKKFSDHPMVLEELDLVDDDDQITHEVDLLEETVKGEETLNIFKAGAIPPEQYAADEAKWKLISSEILGLEQDEGSDSSADSDEEADAAADRRAQDRAEKRDSAPDVLCFLLVSKTTNSRWCPF